MIATESREQIRVLSPIAATNAEPIATFPLTDNCERNVTLMGEDYIKLSFNYAERVPLPAFAYVEHCGQSYFLKEAYRPTPKCNYYQYEVKFSSIANMLAKHICFRYYEIDSETITNGDVATYTGVQPEPNFSMNGDISDLAQIIVRSIHGAADRVPKYNNQLTVYAELLKSCELSSDDLKVGTPLETFTFEGTNISDALTQIAETFDTEWWLTTENDKLQLHLCKCEDDITAPQTVSDIVIRTGKSLIPYRSQGLLSCEYAHEWSDVPQRILPYGSERNIVRTQAMDNLTDKQVYVSYGKRLRLKHKHIVSWNGEQMNGYIVKDKDGNEVLLEVDEFGAVENEGVTSGIEITEIFEDIYPQGHFVVTKVEELSNCYQITAQACQLDGEGKPLKENGQYVLISETDVVKAPYSILPISKQNQTEDPVIHFESGYLNGREFNIANKSKVTYGRNEVYSCTLILQIVPETNSDDESLTLPSGYFIPRAKSDTYEGDLFALFNIDMPDGYVGMAEQALAQATYNKLVEYQASRPDVKCNADPAFFYSVDSIFLGKRFNVYSELFGDIVTTFSTEYGEQIDINNSLVLTSRVTAFSYTLTKPEEVQFTLASGMVQGTLASIEAAISDQTSDIRGLEQRSINLSMRGWRDAAEMRDMLQTLVAEMMLVGVEKYQFAFTFRIDIVNATTAAQADGLKHSLALRIGYPSGGYLQHTQKPYIENAFGGQWELPSVVTINLWQDGNSSQPYDPSTPYYLYAKCYNDNQYLDDSSFVLVPKSDDNMQEDEDGNQHPSQYFNDDYMLLGILSSEFYDDNAKTSYRVFNRSNGYTQIAGGTITTEQIQDPTRSLIIDFQSNPPRIIAKNGAKIIGNIEFTLSDANVQQVLNEIGEIGGENLFRDWWGDWGTYLTGKNSWDTSILRSDDLYEGHCMVSGTLYSLHGGCRVSLYDSNGDSVVVFKVIADNTLLPSATRNCLLKSANGYVLDFEFDVEDYISEQHTAPFYLAITPHYVSESGLEYRIYADQIMLQKGNTRTMYKPYVEHLANALKGSTEVKGGLVMTHLLMLKNTINAVTAGMSGLDDDDITLWGGGTYAQALAAIGGGTTLPILLTKAGAGSNIGCLKVDADGNGISIIKSSGNYIHIDEDEITIYENGRERISLRNSDLDLTEITVSTTVNIGFPDDSIEIVNAQNRLVVKITEAYYDGVTFGGGSAATGSTRTISAQVSLYRDGSFYRSLGNASDTITIGDGFYLLISDAIGTTTFNNVPTGTYEVKVEATHDGGYVRDGASLVAEGTMRYIPSHRKTIVANNGLVTIFDGDSYFCVQNTDRGQNVLMKGLPTTALGLSDGQLWVNTADNSIRIVRDI